MALGPFLRGSLSFRGVDRLLVGLCVAMLPLIRNGYGALVVVGLGGVVKALDYLIASNRVGFGDSVAAFADGTRPWP